MPSEESLEDNAPCKDTSSKAGDQELETTYYILSGMDNLGYDSAWESTKLESTDIRSQNIPTELRAPAEHVDDVTRKASERFQARGELHVRAEEEKVPKSRSCSLNTHKGVTLGLLSTLATCLGALSVSALSGQVSSNEVLFFQMVHIFLFSLSLGTFQKASFRMTRTAFLWVLFRSVVGSVGSMLIYYAYQVMPVGNSKAILYTSPIFTGLFSCLLLDIPCSTIDVTLSIITLCGVLLVIQPPFIFGSASTFHVLGAIFSLLSAVVQATAFIALKKLSVHRVHPQTLLFVFAVVGLFSSIVVTTLLDQWVIPNCWSARKYLIATGVFSFFAHWLITLAAKYERPTTLSLIKTSDVMFTFILEYFLFGRIPNYITIIGASLILGCLVGITIHHTGSPKRNDENKEDKGEEKSNEHD